MYDASQKRPAFEVKHYACFKPIFRLATLFARREPKTGIRQRDWLKLAGEKIRREQVGTVPTFLSVRANKFAKWKIGFIRRILVASNAIQTIDNDMIHLIIYVLFELHSTRLKCDV